MKPVFANAIQSIVSSKWKQLGVVLAVQGLLMLIAFNKVITSPNERVFVDVYDGVKNYYTFVWYVEQADTVPYLIFNGMNYPYNEYIYYTDNSPVLAVATRWVHLNLIDLSGHTVAVYNWIMFLSVWLATMVLFFILRRLHLPVLWTIICSICLVWLHPQALRYSFGTFNLGFMWVLLLTFYGMLRLYGPLQNGRVGAVLGWSLALAGIVIFSSFCHLYYLAMLLLWVAGFLGVMVLGQAIQRRIPWLPIVSGIIIAGLSVAVCYGTILFTDGYYDYRLTNNAGYGERSWILHFPDLVAPYGFNTLQFIFNVSYSNALESHSYLGAAALYGALALLVMAIWKAVQQKAWPRFAWNTMSLFWVAAGISVVVMMFIAMSEVLEIAPYKFVTNYFNLFYYLRPFTDKVTQFRSLGRFVWPLFWVFNIGLLCLLARKRVQLPSMLFAVLLVFMLVDTVDVLGYYNKIHKRNPFAPKALQQIRDTYTDVEPSRYQAFIPIPFFHVGSENYDITMDHYEDMAKQAMQFTLAWDMPMMACQMSRTAEYQALNLTALFQGRGISSELVAEMNDKPVLILERIAYADHCAKTGQMPEGWEINLCELSIVQTTAEYHVYEWWPKGKP